jgi:hypothetical protein
VSSVHVFLGPSLKWGEARTVLPNAQYLPPAKAGDVYTAVRAGATVIAIIDGYFEQVPAVWHKEILYALSVGVWVFGASSMGALRAAELHQFGMVGVGQIFEAYRDGVHEDDDEVVVVHVGQERGFAAVSDAMVNIRDGLAEALRRGIIGQLTHDTIAAAMKRRYYPERNWLLIPEIAEQEHLPSSEIDDLISFVKAERPNRKRLDALDLLTVLQKFDADIVPFVPEFEFEKTIFWDQLVTGLRSGPGRSSGVGIEAMRSHIGLVDDDAEATFRGALLLYLAVKEAHRTGVEPDPDSVARVAERFRRSHGLMTQAATDDWMRRNAMAEVEFDALMEVLALIEALVKHHSTGVDAFLPAELQRQGRFDTVAAAIAEKQEALADYGNTFPSAEDLGTTPDALLDWYEGRYRTIDDPLQDHIDVRRFISANRFVREIVAEYLREGAHLGNRTSAEG